jgi:hypothetical protein
VFWEDYLVLVVQHPSIDQQRDALDVGRIVSGAVRVPRLAIGFSQHADEHRPEDSILLAVDQEVGEREQSVCPL